ncbi:hypothetical protein EJD96_16120 [Herbaspirillum seropedicae]|uniref:hypothetical protein n=1 Tax=Herbaspirillum seropedicae TaxID=964 RepID=UPI001123C8AE|nr:hypothetical protein [Herbaspirillum seropedicae]QDD65575.1 hypothetical protein EJD96_16120 [Herbaspirillum seropedicae]
MKVFKNIRKRLWLFWLSRARDKVMKHHVSSFFSGDGLTLNGTQVQPIDIVPLRRNFTLDVQALSHLFLLLNDSSVVVVERTKTGVDGSPPGVYLESNHPFIEKGHVNCVGIYENDNHGLFVDGVYIDHVFFDKKAGGAPDKLGTVGFFLLAYMAYETDLEEITLLAGGGAPKHAADWAIPNMVGYKVWPKFGFNAPLEPDEVKNAPHLSSCKTVWDVIRIDAAWWEDTDGNGRVMRFDLSPFSKSWRVLLSYIKHAL